MVYCCSVIRFRIIQPLWQNFKSALKLMMVYFVFQQHFEPTLPNCLSHCVNFHCCKWPNIERKIWPSGHTVGTKSLADPSEMLKRSKRFLTLDFIVSLMHTLTLSISLFHTPSLSQAFSVYQTSSFHLSLTLSLSLSLMCIVHSVTRLGDF